MTDSGCLVVIPARGGSKGIPGKNLRDVGGLPLVGRAVRVALDARTVGRVVVSTDSPAIAEAARRHGAEAVMRPDAIAGDLARSEDAVLHTIDVLRARGEALPELVCMLQCTSPLTLPADIDAAVETLTGGGFDSLLVGTPTHGFLWCRGEDGGLTGVNHDWSFRPMRQERRPEFLETGAFYLMRREGFERARYRFFGRIGLHLMPPERVLEIDEPADLALAAERLRQRENRPSGLPARVRAVVFDFDGVMTDDRVYVFQDGREAVACHRGDGMGVELLTKAGIHAAIISKERNPVVTARARKLGIPVEQGVEAKLGIFRALLERLGVPAAEAIFVGNDVNDIECLRAAGCGIVVADAHPAARAAADLVLTRPGGEGAVREVCDMILAAREHAAEADTAGP